MITIEEHQKRLEAVRKHEFGARVNDLNALREFFGKQVEEIVLASRAKKIETDWHMIGKEHGRNDIQGMKETLWTWVLEEGIEYEVEDQEGEGTTVMVGSVTLPSPGFVEVRADDGGTPGRRLGLSDLLPTGTVTGLEIELDDALAADAVLWVRVRIDLDGDEDLGTEDPVALDDDGRRVLSSLSYTFTEEGE